MNKRSFSALCISACLPWLLQAQLPASTGIPNAAAGAYSKSHADLFSIAYNSASLSLLDETALAFQVVQPYQLKELAHYRVLGALPTASGNFGFRGDIRGSGGYRESQAGISYARNLGSKLSAGLLLSYNSFQIPGYGQAATPGAEAGIILHVTEQIHAGFQVRNPLGGQWGPGKTERLPAVYVAGIGYAPSPVFYTSVEVEKEEEKPAGLLLSLQYKPVPRFLLRAGMGSKAATIWTSAGFLLRRFRIDLCSSFHPQLGITPGLSVLFHFKKAEQ